MSSIWRPRHLAVGCAWFIMMSTLTTLMIALKGFVLIERNRENNGLNYFEGASVELLLGVGNGSREELFAAISSGDVIGELSSDSDVIDRSSSTSRDTGNDVIENGIFWSRRVEKLVPVGGFCRY